MDNLEQLRMRLKSVLRDRQNDISRLTAFEFSRRAGITEGQVTAFKSGMNEGKYEGGRKVIAKIEAELARMGQEPPPTDRIGPIQAFCGIDSPGTREAMEIAAEQRNIARSRPDAVLSAQPGDSDSALPEAKEPCRHELIRIANRYECQECGDMLEIAPEFSKYEKISIIKNLDPELILKLFPTL